MSAALPRLTSILGLNARDYELRTATVSKRVAVDGALPTLLGSLPTSDPERPWTIMAARVDAGSAAGLVHGLALGTAEGRGDLWSGDVVVGEWMPMLIECPWKWDGALWAESVGAELAGGVEVETPVPRLGGNLDGSVVGAPFDADGVLNAFTGGTDYVAMDYNGGGASGRRTVGVEVTPDFAAPAGGSVSTEAIFGHGVGQSGLELRVQPNNGAVFWDVRAPGGSSIVGGAAGTVAVPNLTRQWLFLHVVFDQSANTGLYRFNTGAAAVVESSTRPSTADHDLSESTTLVGDHYVHEHWAGTVHHLALWDGHLSVSDMGAIAEAGAPRVQLSDEAPALLGYTAGMEQPRAAGGAVTLLLVRHRRARQ